MKKLFAILALVVLSACSVLQTAPTSTPQQMVFAAKQDYAVALAAAVKYKRLPPCSVLVTVKCADARIVKQLQVADIAASTLLDGAEATVRSGGSNTTLATRAATQAVDTFTVITKMLEN